MSDDLTLDFLKDLLSQPERASRAKKPSDTRDHDTWFKLTHNINGYCANDECVAEVLGVVNQFSGKRQGRNRVTAVVNDYEMCRFCFLDGWHYISS